MTNANIQLHYQTLADMGRFNYWVNGVYVFEMSKVDYQMHPSLKDEGVSHIMIFQNAQKEWDMEYLYLTAPTYAQADTYLPVRETSQAETYLPAEFGAEYLIADPC